MADPCASLRAAVQEQVSALIPDAPEGFVSAWEELEAAKVGGLLTRSNATAVNKYKHRVVEIKRALRGHPVLAAQVVAGTVTPTALAEATGESLAAAAAASEATGAARKDDVRAADVAASRRFQLQYLRQLTARSPGDIDCSDSESDADLEVKTPRRASIKSRRQSRKSTHRDSLGRRLSLQSDRATPGPGAAKRARKRASGATGGRRGSDASQCTERRVAKMKARIGSPPVFGAMPTLPAPKQQVRSAPEPSRAASGYAPVKYKQASKPEKKRRAPERSESSSTPRVQKKVQKISHEKSAMPHKRKHREGALQK